MTDEINAILSGTLKSGFFANGKGFKTDSTNFQIRAFDPATNTWGDPVVLDTAGLVLQDGTINQNDLLTAVSVAFGVATIGPVSREIIQGPPLIPGGRLTVSSSDPTYESSSGVGTLYYLPYVHDRIPLYDASNGWVSQLISSSNISLSGITAGLPYDIFAYGNVSLEKVAWTNATTRATALALQDGRWVKSGAPDRLYLGTICGSASGQTMDYQDTRFVWNAYNRIRRKLNKNTSTDSWTYNSSTWRAWNNTSSHKVEVVTGLPIDAIELHGSINTRGDFDQGAVIGIGYDSTTVNSADLMQSNYWLRDTFDHLNCSLVKVSDIGLHTFYAIEKWQGGSGSPSVSFKGTDPYDTRKAGILGTCWA